MALFLVKVFTVGIEGDFLAVDSKITEEKSANPNGKSFVIFVGAVGLLGDDESSDLMRKNYRLRETISLSLIALSIRRLKNPV